MSTRARRPICVLTIAGSDSCGGAGIQADLKTFAALGAHGMSVVTALTAQNTLGVRSAHEAPPEFVGEQIEAVLSDIGADAAKTGMLASPAIVRVVARKLQKHRVKDLVVDPVMVSKSGHALLAAQARRALVTELLPLALVMTPNLDEAEALTGIKVQNLEQAKEAAIALHALGPRNVLVKGGHLSAGTDAVDILYDGHRFSLFRARRIRTRNTHGTGCCLSAAIATFLAQGCDVADAVEKAKTFVTQAIRASLKIGQGWGQVNPCFRWPMR
ncbi:MAG: bifunctional hydroxymethylpyrimidine kinase/phosphomethylpyrimidine kinase [Planctomycetes bacterium]|nr:bifunctional hydroxymethylpyrimidine kinase/phosphomethylpyrimidine kinase [Planctomycetota bacterium]MBM4080469.1 bifunctional hydroxymethylpyrimidine kinase/phosphomethylpyrimidine kinase [Planctomycetota bacterium]